MKLDKEQINPQFQQDAESDIKLQNTLTFLLTFIGDVLGYYQKTYWKDRQQKLWFLMRN